MDVPCSQCGALHWMDERLSNSSKRNPRFGLCCMEGKVRIPPIGVPPQPLLHLLTSDEPAAVKFREDSWKYNRAFAFTSIGVQEDHSVNRGQHRGPPVFRICGELYHRTGALSTAGETLPARPRYAQLYIYEPRAALDMRMSSNADLNRNIMQDLQSMLNENHQYVPVYKYAHEILQQYDPANDVQIRLQLTPGLDRRRYNLPTADEVAVILPGNTATQPRDIVLRLRSGPLQRISDCHPAYAPLQYPLLFPYGENGWYPEMKLYERSDTRRLTLTRYVAHRIHFRPNEFNSLLRGGRLFTRYIVDMFASADQQRLSWIVKNQAILRAARFNNLEDASITDGPHRDLHDLGQRIILPASHTASARYMFQGYQDAMALARHYRKVDIFLTATCNP
ncbi:hypothetical protein CPC08DRAFT_617191, partial [Agrocybe pediades]